MTAGLRSLFPKIAKMPSRPPSLFRLVSLAVAAVTAVPIIGVSVIVGGTATARVEAYVSGRFQNLADRVTERLDQGLQERLADVRSLAAVLGSDLSPDAQSRLRAAIEAMQASAPEYGWIGLAASAGQVLVATDSMLEGQDVSNRPWFRGALQGPFVGDVHDAVLLAKLLGPAPDGSPVRFVDVAAPVTRPDGVPVAVLGGHLSWTWADEVQRSILGTITQGGSGAEGLVLAKNGTVLLGPPDLLGSQLTLPSTQAAAQGVRRTSVETWPDGREYLTAVTPSDGYRDYPGLGWIVVVRQDADVAFAPARAIRWQLATVGLAAALLALAVGLWLARRVTRPLTDVAAAAERVRQGDLTAHVPYTRAYAEVATLSATLVDLEARLAEMEPAAPVRAKST